VPDIPLGGAQNGGILYWNSLRKFIFFGILPIFPKNNMCHKMLASIAPNKINLLAQDEIADLREL
jgi:hypothetical protein